MLLTPILDINLKDLMDSLDRLMMFGEYLMEEITHNFMSFKLQMLHFLSVKMAMLDILEWGRLKNLMKIPEIGASPIK